MPIEERCNTGVEIAALGTKQSLTRQRYVELVQLAKTASEELTKHGLLRHEYCEFGRIMEKIIQME